MLDIDIDLKCFADNEKMVRGCRQHKELLFSPCESPERDPYESLIKYIPCIHMSGLAVWLVGWLVVNLERWKEARGMYHQWVDSGLDGTDRDWDMDSTDIDEN
jgi:hypothetical protein